MNIGLDFDGVIADGRKLKAEITRELFGVDIPYEVHHWPMVVPKGLLTQEQNQAVSRRVHYEHTYNQRADEVPGAIAGIKELIASGHNVRVVTGRTEDSAKYATEFLAWRGIHIPLAGVGAGVSKREATMGLDVFVENDLEKLLDLDVPNRFLLIYPYNTHEIVPDGVTRTNGWQELLGYVRKIDNAISYDARSDP